jgi:predicted hydrocarbon binding protein
MIRDTFESNPGLCELFKRKILEKARFVGLDGNLLDFATRIDMKGTYQDNLRVFYREYPQLSQNFDRFRIRSIRPLSGAALEQSWRSYERDSERERAEPTREPTDQLPTTQAFMPDLIVTYTVGCGSLMARNQAPKELEQIPAKPVLTQVEADSADSTYRELVKSILGHVTAMAGEKVTKTILHYVGQEIGSTALNCSGNQMQPDNLVEALDRVLNMRGLGRVTDINKTVNASSITYTCTIKGWPLCPTCDILRGVISRWLESFVQKKPESIETCCVSTGSQLCVFRVTFKK